MKRLIPFILTLTILAFSSAGFADDTKQGSWKNAFVTELQQGKQALMGESSGGLAYTPTEEAVLENAIQNAMQNDAPPCECMTLAIEMEYNPYMVIKNIYAFEGELDLDELCLCATQKGVSKQIIAKAAMDAQRDGQPAFMLDEVTQSNCLQSDEGLAYTLADQPPEVIPPTDDPPRIYTSVSGLE